jgi:hypothetical protein
MMSLGNRQNLVRLNFIGLNKYPGKGSPDGDEGLARRTDDSPRPKILLPGTCWLHEIALSSIILEMLAKRTL